MIKKLVRVSIEVLIISCVTKVFLWLVYQEWELLLPTLYFVLFSE